MVAALVIHTINSGMFPIMLSIVFPIVFPQKLHFCGFQAALRYLPCTQSFHTLGSESGIITAPTAFA